MIVNETATRSRALDEHSRAKMGRQGLVQTEAMGQPDAQMGETEKKLLDTVATRDGSVQTEVMGRPGTQAVEFACPGTRDAITISNHLCI